MKTFKVTVDGQSYTVEVEEIEESSAGSSGNASTPASRAESAPVTGKTQEHKEPAGQVNTETAVDKTEKNAQEKPAPTTGGTAGKSVKAPMPGSVLEVKVSVGDEVSEGDVLLVLEAMKMENELTASQAGTVSEVLVKKGDTVNSGDSLVVLS